ncbi:MAG: nucleotide pyrophosphatase, partial [Acidobacteriia bacterium]|nr:nucleotide pyrophosphatase [Terriglobia bacterium]
GHILDNTDAKVIVAANGGSDLIYIPDHDPGRLQQVVSFLTQQDYVGGIFVDDAFGAIPGTLPLSAINLVGSSVLPRPAIALNFKTFYTESKGLQSAVQIADSGLQEGQGMHGSLGRDNTFNNMAAMGPDFKRYFVDKSPVSNADIAPTLAAVMGLQLPSNGKLMGRVLQEALRGGPQRVPFERHATVSDGAKGRSTALFYQTASEQLYLDAACFGGAKDWKTCRQ